MLSFANDGRTMPGNVRVLIVSAADEAGVGVEAEVVSSRQWLPDLFLRAPVLDLVSFQTQLSQSIFSSNVQPASGGYNLAASPRNTSGARNSGNTAADTKVKGGQPMDTGYGISYDEPDNRINADLLYSRSELDADNDQPFAYLMPMGIPRFEHKKEVVAMATAAEIEAREHGDQLEEESDDELWAEESTGYKSEGAKDEAMCEHAMPKAGSFLKIKKPDGTIIETDVEEIAAGEAIGKSKKTGLSRGSRKGRKWVKPKDPEEEYHKDVLRRNLKHLGALDDDAQAKGEAHPREGKVFLFQLPPILPPLVVKKEKITDNVKAEPNDDVVLLDVPHGDPTSVDLTKDEEQVAEGKTKAKDKRNEVEKKRQAGREWPKTGGFIGKLVVRKSGKVTLDWGGLPMAVEAAIPVSFIRTAVLVDQNDTKPNPNDPSQFDGTAYGMGRIEEKFCCAPIFSPPEPWVIDPKDLEPPTEE